MEYDRFLYGVFTGKVETHEVAVIQECSVCRKQRGFTVTGENKKTRRDPNYILVKIGNHEWREILHHEKESIDRC